MPALHSDVLDNGLAALSAATHFHVCTDEPANYAELAAVTVANKAAPSIGAVADASPNGRHRQIAAFTGGTVTATALGDCWALVDATVAASVRARATATATLRPI